MTSLEALVDEYIERCRPSYVREFEYFSRVLRSDEEAVSRAALAQRPNGKRHWHQRRIPRASLEESQLRLLNNLARLRESTTFDELLGLANKLIRPISKIGELTVCDTTLRIGARFGLEPERVYVHAGTRQGVLALGLDSHRDTIEMTELPIPIHRLSPREAEDFLCRFKSRLH